MRLRGISMNRHLPFVVIMLVLCVILLFIYVIVPSQSIGEVSLACEMKIRHEQCVADRTAVKIDKRRIVALGDVHGAYDIMLEDLYDAKIIKSRTSCEWKQQEDDGVVLVQQGDIVDRGAKAWEALQCLRHLQKEAHKYNSKVVRLIGNHELWWVNGIYYKRNPTADTRQRIIDTVNTIYQDVADGTLQAAYVHYVYDVPILFIHAGVRPEYYTYLQKQLSPEDPNKQLTPIEIAAYFNNILQSYLAQCKSIPCAPSQNEFFEAGPDRGGTHIGGPLWTDFDVLSAADTAQRPPTHFLQVVGHTMAYCYNPSSPGTHPPAGSAECALGLVRASAHLQAICVDGGMWLGAHAYMVIGSDGHYRSYQKYWGDKKNPLYNTYRETDLTEAICSKH